MQTQLAPRTDGQPQLLPWRGLAIVLAVLLLAALVAIAVLSATVDDRLPVETRTGVVDNVSNNALVVVTDDEEGHDRLTGLLASEWRVRIGDRVTVQVIGDAPILRITAVR